MIVEYLFEMSPFTLGLIVLTFIFLVSKSVNKGQKTNKVNYEKVPVEFITYKESPKENPRAFRVASYNILSHNFTKYEWFSNCAPRFLEMKYRAPRIIAELEALDADFICLQECDNDLFLDFYKKNLEFLGYNVYFKITSSNKKVTNAFAYKKNLFNLLESEVFDLSSELIKKDESFNKHKDAIILTLLHNATGKTFVITNTHLFWNPEFEYLRYGQLATLITYLEKKYSKYPLIVCGDFNAVPTSNVLRYVYNVKPVIPPNQKGDYNKNKNMMEKFYEEYSHKLNLRSAYDSYKLTKFSPQVTADYSVNHPDFTTYTEEFKGTIDYILFTNDSLELLNILKIQTNDPNVINDKLPNSLYPSDHFKIAAQFNFL